MKKFIVKYKDSEKTFGEYNSRKEASKKIMAYINDCNEDLDEDFVSPFDFVLEEVECKDVNEEITDFESAKKYLVGNRLSKSIDRIKDAEILIKEINPKHIEALVALNELFTIAEAWNKADGFVPDFSDREQFKWIPCFKYDKDAARFLYCVSSYTTEYASACLGPHFCFMTPERAEQFGRQFIELYNKVFL